MASSILIEEEEEENVEEEEQNGNTKSSLESCRSALETLQNYANNNNVTNDFVESLYQISFEVNLETLKNKRQTTITQYFEKI